MAQAQLNDPPLHQETTQDQTSLSDQTETSHLDNTRPPDPPDPSLSLRSDEQSQSSLSLSPARATGCLYNDVTMQFFYC